VASFLNDHEDGGAGPSLWLDLGSQWRTHGRHAFVRDRASHHPADGNEADAHDSEDALRRAWLATALAHRAHNQVRTAVTASMSPRQSVLNESTWLLGGGGHR
jgi:hypothetical protein